MKFIFSKVIVVILIISLSVSLVACSSWGIKTTVQDEKIITEDSQWFYGEIVDVDLGIDDQRPIAGLLPRFAGADEEHIVVFSDGEYMVDDWSKVESNADFAIKTVSIIDRASKQLVKTIDLYSLLNETSWPESVLYYSGKIIVNSTSWDAETASTVTRDYYIDPESETIVGFNDYEEGNETQYVDSFFVGEYRIDTFFYKGTGKKYCPLRVYMPDGSVRTVDIKDSEKEVFWVPLILALDDTTALVAAATENEYRFFKLDLNTCEISDANTNEYAWLDIEHLLHSYNGSEGNVLFTTKQGISKIDLNSKTVDQIFDYNCCGVNRQYLSNLEIADCSEDSFLLCGQYSTTTAFDSVFVKSYAIVELTRADKNPHAGKKVIELYVPDGKIDSTISDAIITYNDTNSDYFIKVSTRYNIDDYFGSSDIGSQDDYDSAWLQANASLSNDLIVDIMNGEGPDIFLNTSEIGQLNNEAYLADLSPYVSDLSSDKYFINIIDGAKTDGKLYQLPISFTIEGIQTDPQFAGSSGAGFTTNEYKTFLYDVLDGKDVIESGQALYFAKLFSAMSDVFIKDGQVDFSCPEFEQLAEYVKDNVPQSSIPWLYDTEDEISANYVVSNDRIARYCNCPGISGYLIKRAQISNGTAILGIPSTDGRGPMFGTDISIAISSRAVNADACADFVKILLSDDIQTELVMSDKLVINRDALRRGCNAAIDYFNNEVGTQEIYDYEAGTYVRLRTEFTTQDTDNLEDTILSCSRMNSADSDISMILIEEMPAYFLSQKDLASVVVIIQDRVQKVLDERG